MQRSATAGEHVKDVWLGSTTGLEFEDVCVDIFKGCGLRTKKVGGTGDGGIDALVWNKYGKIIVECKHQASPIGRPVVQKLHSAMMTANAVGGIIVSTGGFKKTASRHPNSHTSSNVLNFIRVTRSGSILLVDLDGLRSLAGRANVRLHGAMNPSVKNVNLIPLMEMFSVLKSSPHAAISLIRPDVQGHQIDTFWVVDVSIAQDFHNSAGRRVHSMVKSRRYACDSDGRILGGNLAKFVLSGGDAAPKNTKTPGKRYMVTDMQHRYTKRVGYKGSNGASYSKICKPSERYMSWKYHPVGVERTLVMINIMNKKYMWHVPPWDDVITCSVCGKSSKRLNPLLICNDCGTICHAKKCGGQCNTCKKTVCGSCAVTKSKFLRTKRYCTACFNS